MPKEPRYPPLTWIDDPKSPTGVKRHDSTPPYPVRPSEPYDSPEAVPAALRQQIKALRDVGYSPLAIAQLLTSVPIGVVEKILGPENGDVTSE